MTKGTLSIPPTYFAVQHALQLGDRLRAEVFTMAARIDDAAIAERIRIHDAGAAIHARMPSLTWSRRERLVPLVAGRMRRDIRRFEPDVVHQHFANWSGAARLAARDRKVPLLLTLHGADVYVPLTPLSERNVFGKPTLAWHQRTVRSAYRDAARILAVSEYLAGQAVAGGADAAKVVVHYQGVDTDLYQPVEKPERERPLRVVFVGGLSRAKGIPDLLAASAAANASTPHELVVVGDGALRDQVREAASDPRIRMTGQIDREGVKRELAAADLFVLPTQAAGRWREAAGLVTLEAQAMGVPVVVYDSGGAGEMLRDGDTGLLVRERDVDALADAIRGILGLSSAERRAMGERARRFVVEHRSLARSAEQLLEHYQEVIG
ncbi:glycosyltransferase [Microbacterium sp. JZ31]|uniref:glycosyltransferase n=1 Tax=Microbacterium sp. JZ31 TaxID=1906274 RepID=UPI001933C1F1|nr:glycosyltransferase [Microbacterium sp. JZ31]